MLAGRIVVAKITPILRYLYGHRGWPVGVMWRAIARIAPASHEKAIRDRLHHIHSVQRYFIWAAGDRAVQPVITKPDDFASLDDLRAYARESHDQIRRFFASAGEARFDDRMAIPWVQDPPLTISVTEALTQAAMPSQRH